MIIRAVVSYCVYGDLTAVEWLGFAGVCRVTYCSPHRQEREFVSPTDQPWVSMKCSDFGPSERSASMCMC